MDINTAAQAEQIVEEYVLEKSRHDFVIIPEKTQSREFGWIVYFNTKKYIETGDKSYLVPGTAPVIVTRDGNITRLSTGRRSDILIMDFEKKWKESKESSSE